MTPFCNREIADGRGQCGQIQLMLKRLLDRMRGLYNNNMSKKPSACASPSVTAGSSRNNGRPFVFWFDLDVGSRSCS